MRRARFAVAVVVVTVFGAFVGIALVRMAFRAVLGLAGAGL